MEITLLARVTLVSHERPGSSENQATVLQAPIVQKVDNAIHRINYYPLDSAIGLSMTYPLDSNLSGG